LRAVLRTLPVLALAAAAATGCAAEPEAPKQRVLVESQVRAFTDQVLADRRTDPDYSVRYLAENPDGGTLGGTNYREAIEATGRAVCSHMIIGVPVDQAFQAAYPRAPRDAKQLQMSQHAADTLCPLR
jgi:hypothetical protein